ncbi:hypothetical protein C9374_007131 [Naegleria lovaniensis]|uniref:Uncharacterized protein n=1 Tax=Naegleria lovaniensis TaxID=51637 RepID=A0AA88H2Q7_NAELO|nr:uncharacterized protein C9374_013805 [Naegleria lovaniensis]XP_044555494.1 uncharacterized protein C9374_007131 [Naegleria lovaniensis]KAG2370849.1 hypothetical protein C9374_013805 [Naegleria lovaniensis]KAG2393600.1 hypothetical protein C9374_007131 [Naegleria lovaniensis]
MPSSGIDSTSEEFPTSRNNNGPTTLTSTPIFQNDSTTQENEAKLLQQLKSVLTDTNQPTTFTKNDTKLQQLQQQLEECSKKAHSFLYTTLSVAGAVPLTVLFKTMKPLYIFPLIGGAADFWITTQKCAKERTEFDRHMLKRRRYELISEKKRLEMERNALLDELKRMNEGK